MRPMAVSIAQLVRLGMRDYDHVTSFRACVEDFCRRGLDDWKPEDIYQALNAGDVYLAVIRTGYVVLKPSGKNLHIWFAMVPGGQTQGVVPWQKDLEQLALECGFKSLSFGTRRKGWQRLAKRLGYTLCGEHYIKELSSE